MEIEFQSLKDLYNRLCPAFSSKVDELKKCGYQNISKEEIWDYLTKEKWMKSEGLSLHQMVSDIFNASNEEIYQYIVNNNR